MPPPVDLSASGRRAVGWIDIFLSLQGEFDPSNFNFVARNGPQLAPRELKIVLSDSKLTNLAWLTWKPLFGLLARERSENVNSRCGSQRDRGASASRAQN